MTNYSIISYAVADYCLDDINVTIFFAPEVLTCFFNATELASEVAETNGKSKIFGGIFSIIKSQISQYKTFEIWYDLIEYKGVQLVWKSKFMTNTKTMLIDVLNVYGKQKENEVFH